MKEDRCVLETAKIFLKHGNKVVVASIDEEETVGRAMDELKPLGEVTYFRLDVADEKSCKDVVYQTVGTYGAVDVL